MKRKTKDQFIQDAIKVHGNLYDYSKVEYINDSTKVIITCKVHGDFLQKPDHHLSNQGCPICAYQKRAHSTRRSFQKTIDDCNKVHNNKYDYSKVVYINNKTKVCIICPEHGEFWQNIINHLFCKTGCPKCAQYSKGEKSIERWLTKKGFFFISQKRFKECKNKKPLPFDFYLPEMKTCIEYDGEQHFMKRSRWYSNQIVINDKIKNEYCLLNSIRLIRIPFWKRDFIPQILTEVLLSSS